MALFKNLYFDFSFLNPFKKKEPVLTNQPFNISKPPVPEKKFRELPTVSKRLIEVNEEVKKEEETQQKVVEKKHELPRVVKKPVKEPPKINGESEVKPEKPEMKEEKPVEAQETQSDSGHQISETVLSEPMMSNVQESGFFSDLYSHMAKEESYVHANMPKSVIQKDMFNEMQSFWRGKKTQLNKTVMNTAMKGDLMKKIEDLQKQEIDWQKMQLEKERLSDELAHKEILIDNNIRNLKKSFKRLHLTLDIHPDHEFILSNGNRLKNLQELADSLRIMDYGIFESHVTTEKNDFANWIKDVMGLQELADSMRTLKNREVMANLIENWYKKT